MRGAEPRMPMDDAREAGMTPQMRTILIALAAAVVAFGVGSLWAYSRARPQVERLQVTERDLDLQRLEATLGPATIEAYRGSHEIARPLARDLFTRPQTQHQTAEPPQQQAYQQILGPRRPAI